MAIHPLLTHELSLARQDHIRRDAEAVRSVRRTGAENRPLNVRWFRRYVVVEETRCCGGVAEW